MESADFWLETFEVATDKIKVAIYEGLISQLRESIRTTEDFDKIVTEKTNSAANAVQLHVSTMVETLGTLAGAWKATDEFLFGWIDRLRGAKEEGDELAAAEVILAEAIERAGIRAVTQTEQIIPLSEATDTLALRVEDVVARWKELSKFEINWEALKPPSELMARWEEFYNLVETPELDLIWEQQMFNMEEDTLNFMASVIPGMAVMTNTINKGVTDMGKKTKVTFGQIASDVGMALHMIGTRNKAVALASAVINTAQAVSKALSAYPPPISFAMAALQAAAGLAEILTIKRETIPSAEKGAYLPSPAIIEAGHGPMGEVVLPLDKAPAGIGGAKVDFNFYAPIISTTGLSDRDMEEVAEDFFDRMDREARRRGYSING